MAKGILVQVGGSRVGKIEFHRVRIHNCFFLRAKITHQLRRYLRHLTGS